MAAAQRQQEMQALRAEVEQRIREEVEERERQIAARERELTDRLEGIEEAMYQRDGRQAEFRDILGVMRRQDGSTRVKPPVFDGKQNIDKFLETFDQVRHQSRWDDATAALQLKLAMKGSTAESVKGNTYQGIRTHLQTRYRVTEEEARRELRNTRQKKGGNVFYYGRFIIQMTQIAHPTLQRQH